MTVKSLTPRSVPPILRGLIAAACLVIILAGIKAVAPTLTPFLIALLLAQVLSPLMLLLMRQGVRRWLAVTITLLVVFVGGAIVVVSVMRQWGFDSLLVSEADILDGLARDSV